MFVRILTTPLRSSDVSFKFHLTESFRDPFSSRPRSKSLYLGSLRRSRLFSNPHRSLFWRKCYDRLERAGIPRNSSTAEFIKIGIFAKWEELQMATR